MYTIANGRLCPLDLETYRESGGFVPKGTVYTIEQLELEARILAPGVKGYMRQNAILSFTDADALELFPAFEVDPRGHIAADEDVLQPLRDALYRRVRDELPTKLVFKVRNLMPGSFRMAASATPIYVGDLRRNISWQLESLHAEDEEIAGLCRVLNYNGLFVF